MPSSNSTDQINFVQKVIPLNSTDITAIMRCNVWTASALDVVHPEGKERKKERRDAMFVHDIVKHAEKPKVLFKI